jgi:hypothetical protein
VFAAEDLRWQFAGMNTTNLQEGIQLQVGFFMEGVKALVQQAVMEAFEQAVSTPVVKARRGPSKRKERGQAAKRSRRSSGRKRSRREVAEMTERLYRTIESQPGQTIGVLAATMGCGSGDLRVSVRNLITQGRVSKAGARMNTTYFPMDGDRDPAS